MFINILRLILNMNNIEKKHKLGQYFTTDLKLKEKIYEFIYNNPACILEPCIGCGNLISYIKNHNSNIVFDMYEIDDTITPNIDINKLDVKYEDFLISGITKLYKTIIGNPPFVRTKNGNLYIDFIHKCYNLLDINGELIFIIPYDFFKLTCASDLLSIMMSEGTFTHIYHPKNEKLFIDASIDVLVFRYCKNKLLEKKVLYNNEQLYIFNSNGLIIFSEYNISNNSIISNYFDVYVGLVSGKEEVFKNIQFGNIDILTKKNKIEKYIHINNFPSGNEDLDNYLLSNKEQLISRRMRKFNDNNWFEWGALRNFYQMNKFNDTDCIYLYSLTRNEEIAFKGKICYFGGNLIMMKPKQNCNLDNVVCYLNSDKFKQNFITSGRFKIGHRQICNSYIPPNMCFNKRTYNNVVDTKIDTFIIRNNLGV